MGIRKKTSTTKLPQDLLEKIAESSTSASYGGRSNSLLRGTGGGRKKVTRKEARMQKRETKKEKKAEYYSHAHARPQTQQLPTPALTPNRNPIPTPTLNANPNVKKRSAEDHEASPAKKKARSLQKEAPAVQPKKKPAPALPDVNMKSKRDEEEDAYISYLERRLTGRDGKRKKIEEDGLDDLLDWADSFSKTFKQPTLDVMEDEEDEEDSDDEILAEEDEDEDEDEDDIDDEDEEEENRSGEGEEDEGDDDDDDDDDDEEEWGGIVQDEEIPTPKPTGAYIPPHLRKQTDEQQQISRHLKGLLNRMSEQNIATILPSVEELYRNHRRNDVTLTITNLVIASISSHSSLLDSYVVIYATFIASLYKIIGIEFGAHFVQTLIQTYEQRFFALFSELGSTETGEESEKGKETSNLLVMISELYNFQVISSLLVFDIIRALLDRELTEFGVELLLKIVRNSGQQLRQDDPLALKDIIDIIQSKVSVMGDTLSSRTKFMIETLTNLKNNKLKRNVTQNQGAPAVERMKKFLTGLGKTKHVLAHEPLRVSLEDLRMAETKGKWWLVGAAWSGDPLVDKKDEFEQKDEKDKDQGELAGDDLNKLARAQGMNTEIRRGIFVVLMSSEDYVDASERLMQLSLTEVQQRETVRVLVHCCGNERAFNPYYAFVGQQLYRTSHGHKITAQFCLWDFLREIGESNVGGAGVIKGAQGEDGDAFGDSGEQVSEVRMKNLARMYAWWIAKDGVSLMVLKPLDFTSLKPRTKVFLVELLLHVLLNSQRTVPLVHSNYTSLTLTRNLTNVQEIFVKAGKVETLGMGLVYFFSQLFFEVGEGEGLPLEAEGDFGDFVKWAVDVAKETLRRSVEKLSNARS